MNRLDHPEPATSSPALSLPPLRLVGAALVGLAAFAALMALGTWQVHRLSWKLALIARVEARVHAPAAAPPGPARWAGVTAGADAYRHVTVAGTFLNDKRTLVQATTEYGAGYWVLVPLRTASDGIVLVNRGFVPSDERGAVRPIEGGASVTGLLRVTEPKGLFLRRNDPAADRWSSRDVAAIAAQRGLNGSEVAPYFIDADAAPNPGGLPIGGLTVVRFPNNHLVYAFTWYAMAAMLAGAGLWFAREEWRARHPAGGPGGEAARHPLPH